MEIKLIFFSIICLLYSNKLRINCELIEQIPLYLSIEVDSKIYREKIIEFVIDNLEILYLKYPQNKQIKADYYDLIGKRQYFLHDPDSWHVTTLYIGRNQEKLNTTYYREFEEEKNVNIDLLSLGYIPGRLFSTPVFLDYDLIENEYPHMTLMLGGKSRAVDSNYLLRSIFSQNKYLKTIYENGDLKNPKLNIERHLKNITLNYDDLGNSEIFEDVYFIKSHYVVKKMFGKTKKNF